MDSPRWPRVAWAALDVVMVGGGMGVPIFAILAGFPMGWHSARLRARDGELAPALAGSLRDGTLVSGLTLLMMAAIWGSQLRLVFQPGFDAAEWGIPLVLYTSTASFWGWMALMIVVSPLLQLLAFSFGSLVGALATVGRRERGDARIG